MRCYATEIPDSKLVLRSIYDELTQITNDLQGSLCRIQCRLTAALHDNWVRHVINLGFSNCDDQIGLIIIKILNGIIKITSQPICPKIYIFALKGVGRVYIISL